MPTVWKFWESQPSRAVLFKLLFFSLAYHCHNTRHVCVQIHTANINANFQTTGLRGRFTCLQVLSLQSYQPPKQQCWGNLKFCSSYFSNLTPLDDGGESAFVLETMERYFGKQFVNVFLYISIHLRQF